MSIPLSTMIGGAGIWTPGATTIGAFGTKKTFNQLIKSLFANNEQGFFYDPNDLTTMFQDAAGTIPVTGAGQPVGLMLDKSKGLTLGSDKVTNGSLLTLTGWDTPTTSPATVTPAANGIRVYSPGGEPATLRQVIVLKRGSFYKVSFDIKSITGTGYISLYSGVGSISRYDFSTVGKKEVILSAASTGDYLLISRSTVCDFVIADVAVKELAGNHTYQTTSASRPILRKNASTGAYYLAFDGSDDFLQTSNIDFTATDKVSLFAGVRKLSDAAAGVLIELSSNASTTSGTFGINAPDAPNSADYLIRLRGGFDNFKKITENPAPSTTVISARLDAQQLTVNNKINVRLNGITSAASGSGTPSTTQNFTNQPLYIGRRGGAALPFNGHIYSLIGVGRLTTDNETKAIEKELAKRTGVTLNA